MSMLLGLDIGGTRSRAQLWADGEVVAESEAGSASLTAVGTASATAALADLVAQLPLGSGRCLDAICAGSAGASAPSCRQFLHARLAPLTRSGTVVIVNDAMLVLPAAGLDAGIALICGTGSVAAGRYGGRQVAITNFPASPIACVADHVLTTAARETTFRSGAMASRIAALTVVDCLFVAAGQRSQKRAPRALTRTYVAVRVRR